MDRKFSIHWPNAPGMAFVTDFGYVPENVDKTVHVIEYSAYEELLEENRKCFDRGVKIIELTEQNRLMREALDIISIGPAPNEIVAWASWYARHANEALEKCRTDSTAKQEGV